MPALSPGIRSAKIGPWHGMNEKVSPDTLPPGVAADLQNVLLDETPGTVVKRLGTRAQAALPSGLPPRDTYVFTKLDGTSYQLVSDGTNLYYTTDPSGASFYTLIVGSLNDDGFMEFETAENKVWFCNGIDSFFSWDGTTLITFNRAFTSTTNLTTVGTTSFIHAGLTATDDYWNGMKLVFTVGSNVGTVVSVTDYVESTKTITFTPAVAGIAATDRFMVGLVIPKGAALRFWDGHLFVGCTADNKAEMRFSEISDPNTGAVMTLDNPQAWPSANELALNVLDQEKLWGITPILRDRIMAHKASGIWRVERDPLTVYRLELISRAIGSRFPDTWAEKNNLLYFLGQDKDGFPEIYKTDMTDVNLVDPDGGIEPTLRSLQQPNAIQQSRAFTSMADFATGTYSDGSELDNQSLELDGTPIPASVSSNIDTEDQNIDSRYHGLKGIPGWEVKYAASGNILPQASAPAWTLDPANYTSFAMVAGELVGTGNPGISSPAVYRRSDVLDPAQNAFVCGRIKQYKPGGLTGYSSFNLGLFNGAFAIWISRNHALNETIYINNAVVSLPVGFDDTIYHNWSIQLQSGGAYRVWLDGVLIDSGTGAATTRNEVIFGGSLAIAGGAGDPTWSDVGQTSVYIQNINYTSFSAAAPASSIALTGTLYVDVDFTRSPEAFNRIYAFLTLHGGSVSIAALSSTSSDFTSGNDPAGYVAVTNGAAPTSVLHRYLRIRLSITSADTLEAPEILYLYHGTLWLSPAIQVGANISAWRTLLDTITTPAGVAQTIKIRRATVVASPAEGDYGAWFVITNGDNIGTILTDATPTSRWIQLKVEQGPSSAGLLPILDAVIANWLEGSATANLPVRAVVHKKRYLLTAASSLAAANDTVVVCDRNDQWTKFAGLSLNALIHFRGNLYGLNSTAATQRLMDVEGSYADDGVAISAYLVSREEDFDAGHLRKNFRYSYLEWDRATAAWALTTSYRRPGESAFTGSGTFDMGLTGQDVRQNFPIATVGKRIQRKYANAVIGENMALMNEIFYFDIRPVQP